MRTARLIPPTRIQGTSQYTTCELCAQALVGHTCPMGSGRYSVEQVVEMQSRLGQAEPATSFTQPHNTVNLDEQLLPKVFTFGILAGAFYFAMKGLLRPVPSYGRDGIDELAREAKRIQRRVAARRRSQRR